MQFTRSITTSLAPFADRVGGITEAKDMKARGGQPGARGGAGRRKQERAAFVEPDGNNEDVRDGAREYRQRADDSGCFHATLASSATVTTMRSSTPEKDATTSTGPDDKSTRPQDMLPASKAVSVSTTRAKAAHLTKEWPSTQAREPPREVQQT